MEEKEICGSSYPEIRRTYSRLLASKQRSSYPMFERYTDEAKRAIFFSRAEALVRKESAISVKDLLLGIAREEKQRVKLIASLKARDAALRSAL